MSLNEEICPVSESLLGELYRAKPHTIAQLTDTLTSELRARLAIYCYRRAHLADVGLALAACCDEDDLRWYGGNLGIDLYSKARTNEISHESFYARRQKVTLAEGAFRHVVAQDLI